MSDVEELLHRAADDGPVRGADVIWASALAAAGRYDPDVSATGARHVAVATVSRSTRRGRRSFLGERGRAVAAVGAASLVVLIGVVAVGGQVRREPPAGGGAASTAAPARWRVAPGAHLAETSTAIPIEVVETECASGQTATGRINAHVEYLVDVLDVVVSVQRLPGGQDCPGNPVTAYTIQLDEPLGHRTIGGEQWTSSSADANPATTPPALVSTPTEPQSTASPSTISSPQIEVAHGSTSGMAWSIRTDTLDDAPRDSCVEAVGIGYCFPGANHATIATAMAVVQQENAVWIVAGLVPPRTHSVEIRTSTDDVLAETVAVGTAGLGDLRAFATTVTAPNDATTVRAVAMSADGATLEESLPRVLQSPAPSSALPGTVIAEGRDVAGPWSLELTSRDAPVPQTCLVLAGAGACIPGANPPTFDQAVILFVVSNQTTIAGLVPAATSTVTVLDQQTGARLVSGPAVVTRGADGLLAFKLTFDRATPETQPFEIVAEDVNGRELARRTQP